MKIIREEIIKEVLFTLWAGEEGEYAANAKFYGLKGDCTEPVTIEDLSEHHWDDMKDKAMQILIHFATTIGFTEYKKYLEENFILETK